VNCEDQGQGRGAGIDRWVLAPMRHRTFFSLGELNAAIRVQLERYNDRHSRKGGTRRSHPRDRSARVLFAVCHVALAGASTERAGKTHFRRWASSHRGLLV
jgi:hypothetical protein